MPRASDDAAARVKSLVALDAQGVMRRLESRRAEMIRSFSRKRDRKALLSVIHSWFDSARFDELVRLEVAQQRAAAAFYEELSDLRWYFEHTEDMPGTAERVVTSRLRGLRRALESLMAALGEDAAKQPATRARKKAARASRAKKKAKAARGKKPAGDTGRKRAKQPATQARGKKTASKKKTASGR